MRVALTEDGGLAVSPETTAEAGALGLWLDANPIPTGMMLQVRTTYTPAQTTEPTLPGKLERLRDRVQS